MQDVHGHGHLGQGAIEEFDDEGEGKPACKRPAARQAGRGRGRGGKPKGKGAKNSGRGGKAAGRGRGGGTKDKKANAKAKPKAKNGKKLADSESELETPNGKSKNVEQQQDGQEELETPPKTSPPKKGPAKKSPAKKSPKAGEGKPPKQSKPSSKDEPAKKRVRYDDENKSFAKRARPPPGDGCNQWLAIRDAYNAHLLSDFGASQQDHCRVQCLYRRASAYTLNPKP